MGPSSGDRRSENNEEVKGGGEGTRRSCKKVRKWVREEEVAKKTTTCESGCLLRNKVKQRCARYISQLICLLIPLQNNVSLPVSRVNLSEHVKPHRKGEGSAS